MAQPTGVTNLKVGSASGWSPGSSMTEQPARGCPVSEMPMNARPAPFGISETNGHQDPNFSCGLVSEWPNQNVQNHRSAIPRRHTSANSGPRRKRGPRWRNPSNRHRSLPGNGARDGKEASHRGVKSPRAGAAPIVALLQARRKSGAAENGARIGAILAWRWRFTISRKERSIDRERWLPVKNNRWQSFGTCASRRLQEFAGVSPGKKGGAWEEGSE